MTAGKEMKPLVIRASGKVEGIRGLYQDRSGRWYVRKSLNGVDRQLTLQVNKNPTFSGLESLARAALKRLEKSISSEKPAQSAPPKTAGIQATAIEAGQEKCRRFLQDIYAKRVTVGVFKERQRELDGFAFCIKARDKAEVDKHNLDLLEERLKATTEKTRRERWKHVRAVFVLAITTGYHRGCLPTETVKRPPDLSEFDCREILIPEAVKIYKALEAKQNSSNSERENRLSLELLSFFYLLTLGMRPSSAILFDASKIQRIGNADYYQVFSHKTERFIGVKHKLGGAWFTDNLKKINNFTYSSDYLLNQLNKIIRDTLQRQVNAKHLRKGFITACLRDGRFSIEEVKRLTHTPSDIIETNYNVAFQELADKVADWYNEAFEFEYIAASN